MASGRLPTKTARLTCNTVAYHRTRSDIEAPGELPMRTRMRPRTVFAFALTILAAGCASVHEIECRPGEKRSVSETMYFGTAKPSGVVSVAEWSEFLRTSVTTRFPRGLTVWQASGQWLGADGTIAREASFVLSLVHPDDESSESAVRAIAAEYKSRFDQEAVLRVKNPACASF